MKFTNIEGMKFEEDLLLRGYKKFVQHYKSEDYMYWKAFERKIDDTGEKTEGYSVGFAFYDFSKYPQYTEDRPICVSMEFMLHMDMGVDRLDITITDDKMSIEDFEEFCKGFYFYYLHIKEERYDKRKN